MEALSEELPPGTKVLLTGAVVKTGVLLLEPKCIQVGWVDWVGLAMMLQRRSTFCDTPSPPPTHTPSPWAHHHSHMQVLGGQVQDLVEAWQVQRLYAGIDRPAAGGDGGEERPPSFRQFVPGEQAE